jgi:hypothetical protein
MASTRSERQRQSWAHLCNDVLKDLPIQQFLEANGITNATAFVRLDDDALSEAFLVRVGDEERSMTLPRGTRNIIADCKHWWVNHPNQDKDVETWLELTTDMLEEYQEALLVEVQKEKIAAKEAALYLVAVNKQLVDAKLGTAELEIETAAIKRDKEKKAAEDAATKAASDSAKDKETDATGGKLVSESKQQRFSLQSSVKKNVSDYKKLSDEAVWFRWNQQFVSTIKLQGFGNIIDKNYVPVSDDDKAEFDQMQTFVFAVLDSCVLITGSKQIIDKHRAADNAQACYQELVTRFGGGEAATIKANRIDAELALMKLDSSYPKTIQKFMEEHTVKVAELAEYRPASVTPEKKLQWLKASLSTHPHMQTAISNWDVTQRHIELRSAQERAAIGLPPLAVKEVDEIEFSTVYRHLNDVAVFEDARTAASRDNGNAASRGSRVIHHAGRSDTQEAQGRGRGRGSGRGGSGRGSRGSGGSTEYAPDSMPFEDILANPNVTLSGNRWQSLTGEERAQLYSARGNVTHTRQVQTANQVPADVYRQPLDNISVMPSVTRSMAPSLQQLEQQDPGAHMQRFMSTQSTTQRAGNTSERLYQLGSDGRTLTEVDRRAHVAIRHVKNARHHNASHGSLIDGGANGGLAGADMECVATTGITCNVKGLDDTEVKDLVIGTGRAIVETSSGPVVGLFPQYAFYGGAESVHAPAQLRSGGLLVDDCPRGNGGRQMLVTACGKYIPLAIRGGLPHMDMRLPLPGECDGRYPTVAFTSEAAWVPTVLDNEWTMDEIEALLPKGEFTLRDKVDALFDPEGEETPASAQEIRVASNKENEKEVESNEVFGDAGGVVSHDPNRPPYFDPSAMAKQCTKSNAERFKFGVKIPKDWDEAKCLDAKNGNMLWAKAMREEMAWLEKFSIVQDRGVSKQFRFDCKHDMRRAVRSVMSGRLTDLSKEVAYSSIEKGMTNVAAEVAKD